MSKKKLILGRDFHLSTGIKALDVMIGGDPFRQWPARQIYQFFGVWGGDQMQRKTILSKSFESDFWRGHAAREAARIVQKDIEDNPYQDKFERFLELTGELPVARSTRLGMKTPLIFLASVTLVG